MGAVTRYAFPVPEWTRTLWVSDAARALWEPRIHRISEAWGAVERSAVGSLRAACIQSIGPNQLEELSQRAVQSGLSLIILQRQGASSGSTTANYIEGQPFAYRVALVEQAHSESFLEAWNATDNSALGNLLCFPDCCKAFFQRVWKDEGWIDTTWPMSEKSAVQGPVECNILLRWIGVRWVTHLPCSFDCEATVGVGRNYRALMVQHGLMEEIAWMDELLDSPMEWSSLHGIAEIKHPLFKISTKTDAESQARVVRREGHRYPERGARGNTFPYQRHIPTESKSVTWFKDFGPKTLIDLHGVETVIPEPNQFSTNGFVSEEAMAAAHSVIYRFVKDRIPDVESIMDFGCGNGRLVRFLAATGKAYGVEQDGVRAGQASQIINVSCETIQSFVRRVQPPQPYDLTLLMPGRLLEMSGEDHLTVGLWLCKHSKKILAYAYGDWLTRYKGFADLCREAGLELGQPVYTGEAVAVGLVKVL